MNLSGIIERHAQFSPGQTALHLEGRDVSYPALWGQVEAATGVLLAHGVRTADRVAWLGLNDTAMLVLLFALARIGAILVPLNYRLAAAEHRAILADAEIRLLVADHSHSEAASDLAAGVDFAWLPCADLSAAGLVVDPSALRGDRRSSVLLVYTSGTTGKPKGVVHTQDGLLWNCVIAAHAHDMVAADHVLTALPLFHVGGLCIQTLPALHAGATVTLQRRFEAGHWLRDVAHRRPSLSLLVPATMRAVVEHPEFASTDLSSLRLLMAGSSVVPGALMGDFHARGVAVGQIYGTTETGPVSIYLRRDEALLQVGAAGRAGLHVDVRLLDAQAREVAAGEVGEICLRAPNVMAGYWRDPDNLAFQDGWFHSGDLAHIDGHGCYRVVGRSRDMIISGGENIYPAEIENVLAACAEIEEVAVVSQSDPDWGEVTVAVVVLRPGAIMDRADVMRRLEGQIARYKMPRRIVFRDHLPKTALGKVQKQVLRASLDGP